MEISPKLLHYMSFFWDFTLFVCVLWMWVRYVNMQPSPVAVSLPSPFFILPPPASTHPLQRSLTPKLAAGLAYGQPNTRICRYMTWMLRQQLLKRNVCQQAAHTYACIVLTMHSLTLSVFPFVPARVLSSHDCEALLFTWVFRRLGSGEPDECFSCVSSPPPLTPSHPP